MEHSAARINSERLRSSSQEMKATFNWELSSRDVFSDPAGSPKLSPPFATSPETVWPSAEALNLRTGDIPGAQPSPPKRPHSQPGPSKLDSHAWLEEEERRTSAKKAFLATKRSINPLEPVYQLPDGGSTIPAGTDGMVFSSRVTDGLAIDDISGTRARSLYKKPARKTRLEEDASPRSQAKQIARSLARGGVGTSVDISDIDIGAKKWGFQRQLISNPLNPRYFYDPAAAILRDAADAEHRARVAVAMNRKATPLEKIEEKLYWKSEQLRAVCARRDVEQLDSVDYKELHESLEELGVRLDEKEALQVARLLDREHTGRVNYRDFSRRLRFPDGVEQAESHLISENDTGVFAAGTSLGQGARVLAEEESKKGKRSEKGKKEWQLLDTVTGRLKIERLLTDDEKRLVRIRQKITERLDTKLGVLDKAFLKFDENRDGILQYEELKQGLEDMGIKLRPHEMETLTSAVDKERKGYIDLSNFKENLQRNTLVLDISELSVKGFEDLQKLETELKAEVQKGGLALYPNRHPGQPIGDKLRAQGKARSRVTREQDHVIAQLRSRLATAIGSMDGAVQKAFRASDLDKDNSISEPELKEMLQTLKVGVVNDEDIKLLMCAVDKDRSGAIQFDELGKALLPHEETAEVRHEQRLARILRHVRARDPDVYKQVAEKLRRNRPASHLNHLDNQAPGSPPRSDAPSPSEQMTQSRGDQPGETRGTRAGEAEQPWDRPPNFHELSQALRELGVYLPRDRLVSLLRKVAPPEADPSYRGYKIVRDVVLGCYALPPVFNQTSSENGTDQNLLKEKKRSRAEKLSRLPSTMTNDKGTTSYKRASSSITLAPMVHRKAYDPPLALMHRRGSDASSQRFDRETEADIKAVRALT